MQGIPWAQPGYTLGLCNKAIARFGDHLRNMHHISKRERIEDLRFRSPKVVDNFTT